MSASEPYPESASEPGPEDDVESTEAKKFSVDSFSFQVEQKIRELKKDFDIGELWWRDYAERYNTMQIWWRAYVESYNTLLLMALVSRLLVSTPAYLQRRRKMQLYRFEEELPVLRLQLDGAYERGGYLQSWYSKDGRYFRTSKIDTEERWTWEGDTKLLDFSDRADAAPRSECKDLSYGYRGSVQATKQVERRFAEWRLTVDHLANVRLIPQEIAIIIARYIGFLTVTSAIWIGCGN